MAAFPPTGLVTLQNVIASYLYVQYNSDDNLAAFVAAFNTLAQDYLDTFNDLNLPVYTRGNISGSLLDWVAAGLYGITRPTLPATGTGAQGPYNTIALNTLAYSTLIPGVVSTVYTTTDDIFRRIITWHFFKGDGRVFNVTTLKRRIYRFLYGANGVSPDIEETYDVSVAISGYSVTITIPDSDVAQIFDAAVSSGALELPFQFSWSVVLV